MGEANWLAAAVAMAVVLGYYGAVDPRLTARAAAMSRALGPSAAMRLSDREGVMRLLAAAAFQVPFALALAALLAVPLAAIVEPVSVPRLLLGAVLGVGELALGSFVAYVVIQTMLAARPALTPRDMRQWIAMSRAGWMQGYLVTLHSVPLPTSVSLTVAYVAVEEIVFRGIMITFLLPLGAVAAVTVSTIVFAIVQAFQMPGWRNAIFPATGAVVMGIVHGTLFVAVPDVAPLIVAHAVFFLAAVL